MTSNSYISGISKLVVLAAVLVALCSCEHKELLLEEPTASLCRTRVVFDWSKAPDANPASMELCLYPDGASHHLSFNLSGKDGGYISLQPGVYGAISMNNDDLDWAIYRNTHDADDFEVYTHNASELGAFKLLSSYLQTKAGDGDRLAATPEMSWSTRVDGFSVAAENGENVITLYPEDIMCHYSVEVRDVGNILSARGEVLVGSLSGMAEGYRHGSRKCTDVTVTMPFSMTADYSANTVRSEFLTFGECHTLKVDHILTVYLFLSDGSAWKYDYDVSSQISGALDPSHVDIVVSGLPLPDPLTSGGMTPEVNDWKTEEVDILM